MSWKTSQYGRGGVAEVQFWWRVGDKGNLLSSRHDKSSWIDATHLDRPYGAADSNVDLSAGQRIVEASRTVACFTYKSLLMINLKNNNYRLKHA
jgi:hypothetical protein